MHGKMNVQTQICLHMYGILCFVCSDLTGSLPMTIVYIELILGE